jgi:caa(3)-type oxidase subunit IV
MTSQRTVTWVWLALVVITIGSWWLSPARGGGLTEPSVPVTAVVLVLAIVKSRFIIRYFMEVRTAPPWLKYATDAWLAVLFGAILVIYLI